MPITYEERVATMQTKACVYKQTKLAAAYAKSLHTKAKNHKGTLAEKIAIKDSAKKADAVTQKLKRDSFELEDRFDV